MIEWLIMAMLFVFLVFLFFLLCEQSEKIEKLEEEQKMYQFQIDSLKLIIKGLNDDKNNSN